MQSAQNELRNETARKGGNFVVMDAAGGDIGGVTITGRAYRCGAPPPQKPVPVTVEDDPRMTVAEPEKTAEERLEELKSLLDKGLITQEEYDQRRQEILQSI
jgi:hypothetical protein